MTRADRVSAPTAGVLAVLAVIAGVAGMAVIPVRHLTGDRSTFVEAVVEADGMVRDVVLRDVTVPVERRLASLAAEREIRSETADGWARVRFPPEHASRAEKVRLEVERRLAEAPPLPGRITVSVVRPREPVAAVLLSGGSARGMLALARDRFVPELLRIDGVERVELRGGARLVVVVVPRPDALAAAGLTALDLVQRLERVGRAVSAGRIRDGAMVHDAVVLESVHSLDELRALRVGPAGGVPLEQLAAISVEPWSPTVALTSAPGRPAGEAVAIVVRTGDRGNALRVARAVRARAVEIGAGLPGVRVSVDDRTAPAARLLAASLAGALATVLAAAAAAALSGRRAAVALFVTAAVALFTIPALALAAGVTLDPAAFAAIPLAAALAVIPPAVAGMTRPLFAVVAAAATIAIALQSAPVVVAAAAFAASAAAVAIRPREAAPVWTLRWAAAAAAALVAFAAAGAVAAAAGRHEPFTDRDVLSLRFTFTDSPSDELLSARVAAVHRRVVGAAAKDCSVLTEWNEEPLASSTRGSSRVQCRAGAARDVAQRVRHVLSVVPSLSVSFDLHSPLQAPDHPRVYVTSFTQAAAASAAQDLAARAAAVEVPLFGRAWRRRVLLVHPLPAAAATIDDLDAQFGAATVTARHGRVAIPGIEPDLRLKPPPGLDPAAIPLRLRDGTIVRAGAVARAREILAPPPAIRYGGFPAVELQPRSEESANAVPRGERIHVQSARAHRARAAAALPLAAAAGGSVFLFALVVLLPSRQEVVAACAIAAYTALLVAAAILLRGSSIFAGAAMGLGAAAAVWLGGGARRSLWTRAR